MPDSGVMINYTYTASGKKEMRDERWVVSQIPNFI